MTATTISGVTLTPWNFYDTTTNAYDNAVYTMMNQFVIASNNVKSEGTSILQATSLIEDNNEQLAMLAQPWQDQTLPIPWPSGQVTLTSPAVTALTAYNATQQYLVNTNILPQYEYTLTNIPATTTVLQPTDISYNTAPYTLATGTVTDPGTAPYNVAANNVIEPIPAGLTITLPNGTTEDLTTAAAVGTPILVSGQVFIVASANYGSITAGNVLVRANYTEDTSAYDQYQYVLQNSLTSVGTPITNPPGTSFSNPPISPSPPLADPGAGVNNMPLPASLSAAAPGTAYYVLPTPSSTPSDTDVFVVATDGAGLTELVRATATGFVQNPSLQNLENWNQQYAAQTPTLPTWPQNLATTVDIDHAMQGKYIIGIYNGGGSNSENYTDSDDINFALTLDNDETGTIVTNPLNDPGAGTLAKLNPVLSSEAATANGISGFSASGTAGFDMYTENYSWGDNQGDLEVNDIQYELETINGLNTSGTPVYSTVALNNYILPTEGQATMIANNTATLLKAGVVTNSVSDYDAWSYSTTPPLAVNKDLVAAYGSNITLQQSPVVGTYDTSMGQGGLTTDDHSPQISELNLNYTGNPPVTSAPTLTPAEYSSYTSPPGSAPSGAITLNTFVENPDGTYGYMVADPTTSGNLRELVLTGIQWNPTSAQVLDWQNQLGAANAIEKTQSLSTLNQNTTVTPASTDFDSTQVNYWIPNPTDPSAPTPATYNVLNTNIKVLNTVGADSAADIPTVVVPTVMTVPYPFSQTDASGSGPATDSNGNSTGSANPVPAGSTAPATTTIVVLPPGGVTTPPSWVYATPITSGGAAVTPFIGQPSSSTIQSLQQDYVNNNSTLSNTGQNEQLQMQSYYAVITSAAQGVATIIASMISERQAIDGNI